VIAISPETQFTYRVKKSAWNTRAWCFQEKLLAPRTIYCCDNEVFVGCSKFVVPETLSLGEDPLKTSEFEHDIRPEFSSAVEDYSQRNLTSERDALDAFRGYLAECDQQTYWASPIVGSTPELSHDDTKETGFCIGLLWYHQVTINRSDAENRAAQPRLSRKSDNVFPSWSWISCRWHVHPLALFQDRKWYPLQFSRHCSISIKCKDGAVAPCSKFFDTSRSWITEETTYLHIRGHLLTFTLMSQEEASKYRDHSVMPWLHLCHLDSAITSDQTLFRRVCFYPDHGRIGADTIASFPETGKALLLGKYRNDGKYAWEESFCFIALAQQPEEDFYTRIGIIVAFAYEPHGFERPRMTHRRFEEHVSTEQDQESGGAGVPKERTEEAKQVALRNIDAISEAFLGEIDSRPLVTVRIG
jgi:hypothetical protein